MRNAETSLITSRCRIAYLGICCIPNSNVNAKRIHLEPFSRKRMETSIAEGQVLVLSKRLRASLN